MIHQFALTYSSSFNSLVVAALFGIFSILVLINSNSVKLYSLPWISLSVGYFVIALSVIYLSTRARIYTQMGYVVGNRLQKGYGIRVQNTLQDIYKEAATGSDSMWLMRVSYKLIPNLYTNRPYRDIIGLFFFVVLWVTVALLSKWPHWSLGLW